MTAQKEAVWSCYSKSKIKDKSSFTETFFLLSSTLLLVSDVRAGEGEGLSVRLDDVNFEVGPRLHFRSFLGSVVRVNRVDRVVDVQGDDDPAKIVQDEENCSISRQSRKLIACCVFI